MTPAQVKAIHRAVNDYKLKVELLHTEHEKKIREILEHVRKERIADIRKSLIS